MYIFWCELLIVVTTSFTYQCRRENGSSVRFEAHEPVRCVACARSGVMQKYTFLAQTASLLDANVNLGKPEDDELEMGERLISLL